MKAYKGFNKDMTCLGFQYEPGKSYEMGGPVKVCKSGFHACEDPMDVFQYYVPGNSRYFEVYPEGDIKRDTGDSKLACSRIKIGAELDIRKLVSAKIKYTKKRTTTEHTDPKQATAGNYGAATAGDGGAATAGYRGAASAGYRGAATAGYRGAATSRGAAEVGADGIACARGTTPRVRGGLGAVLVIGLEDEATGKLTCWKAVVVDDKDVKAGVWYTIKDGELVEWEAES